MSNDANTVTVRGAWGAAAPEWIAALAEACDRGSQASVARLLGVSGAMINQVLKQAYTGRLDRLEARVRGELMRESVGCPVLGEITKRRCMDEQGKPYAATNALRIELRRACPRCPNAVRKNA